LKVVITRCIEGLLHAACVHSQRSVSESGSDDNISMLFSRYGLATGRSIDRTDTTRARMMHCLCITEPHVHFADLILVLFSVYNLQGPPGDGSGARGVDSSRPCAG